MTLSEAALMAQRLPQGWTPESLRKFLEQRRPRVVILRTLWYPEILGALENSAREYLKAIGLPSELVKLHEVPGSYELPLAAQWAFEGGADIVLALGCVLKGETPHFDFVCQATSQGLMDVQLKTSKPLGFGVLTVSSLDQAMARTNKGAEAAQAAVFMALLQMTV
jgi:6,7-dimethyl-8-ribityllumazine synthase